MQNLTTVEMELPEPETDDNAERARHWHNIAHQCGRGMLEAAARVGEVLIEQRDLCGPKPGGSYFKVWCKAKLPFDESTARRYIKIAEHWDELQRHAHRFPDEPLSIRKAIKLINESKSEGRQVDAKRDRGRLESNPESIDAEAPGRVEIGELRISHDDAAPETFKESAITFNVFADGRTLTLLGDPVRDNAIEESRYVERLLTVLCFMYPDEWRRVDGARQRS